MAVLSTMKMTYINTHTRFRKNTRHLEVRVWGGVEAFTLYFTFFSNPSLSDSKIILKAAPLLSLPWSRWQEGGPVGF